VRLTRIWIAFIDFDSVPEKKIEMIFQDAGP